MDIAGTTLINVIVIIEKIFKNLTARQLNTCARVCKVWRDQARREKESRRWIRWNCFVYDGTEDGVLNDDWWNSVTSYILETPVQPKCLLVFCTDTLWNLLVAPKAHGRKRRKTKLEASDIFSSLLPSHCVFQIIVTDGIIGTYNNMKTVELEEHEYDTSLSLIMFGESADIDFVSFSLPHQECISLAKHWSESNSETPLCMQCLAQKEVKMINLYCPMSGIDQEIGYSFFRMFKWPLLAGGYVNEKLLRDSDGGIHSSEKNCMLSGLAICGTGVKVASVLIHSDVDSEEEVAAAIMKLKNHEVPTDRSFGLMYACVGRGCHVYDKHNVESSVFRKHFPKTPLLGFFGNGELGCSYPPIDPLFAGGLDRRSRSSGSLESMSTSSDNDDNLDSGSSLSNEQLKRQIAEMKQKQEAYMMKHPPKLLHAYTTVMCLISLP